MSMDLRKYQELVEKVETAKSESSKAQGVLETLKAELKKEFDCGSIKEAKALLQRLWKEQEEAESEFTAELLKFEDEFGDLLK